MCAYLLQNREGIVSEDVLFGAIITE